MVVKEDKPVNCTIVGDAMIGKSTLVKAFMNDNKPDTAYVATILETFEGRLDLSLNFLKYFFNLHLYETIVICYAQSYQLNLCK